jgi:hypothetical protein
MAYAPKFLTQTPQHRIRLPVLPKLWKSNLLKTLSGDAYAYYRIAAANR